MKNWKSLFVKSDEEEEKSAPKTTSDSFSFPVGNTHVSSAPAAATGGSMDLSVLNEVVAVYEKGIDSINMPGYDFYEFYKAISSIGNAGAQAYQMAFQMAKSMDGNLTAQKLVGDADFYISKINEVHSQYTMQGQQKLNALEADKNGEKNRLMTEIEQGAQQINQLRNQLQVLESEINQKRITLSTVDGKFQPQESSVRQKMLANDNAKQISIAKLIAVKEGIQRNIQ
jgi:hypothetical protein